MVEPADGFGMRMRHEPRAPLGITSYSFNRAALRLRACLGIALFGAMLMSPVDVAAQSGGDGFLFRAPRVTLSLHGGYAQARGGSDLFDQMTDLLIFDKKEFAGGFTFGGDVGVRATDRLDVVFGAMYSRSGDVQSEDSLYFDPGPTGNDSLPILQDNRLTRVPLTANLRFYLAPRGRTIGRFAWVPSTLVPYVGVGAGAMYHKFEQEGSFVDFQTLEIRDDALQSSGWSALAQVLGGFEIALGPRTAILAEGRYLWSSADVKDDFEGFEPIDLAGFQATAGLSFRF